MRSFRFSFDSSREISGAFGLLVVALVALAVAWFTMLVGDRIITSAQQGAILEARKQSVESGLQY